MDHKNTGRPIQTQFKSHPPNLRKPGVAILHTVYAIYHLARPSKGRTPASSASYMLFAAIVDAGLIPFLVFTAMIARAQYTEPSDTPGAWSTLFNDSPDTYKIIFSTFLFSVVNGSIHLISLTLSIYLAMLFRQIAKLPPDMNPLEDNLTSRHKRNKSSLSTVLTDSSGKRDSQASAPLMDSPRAVPFMHTRTDSSTNLTSPHRRPVSSNNTSRVDTTSLYQQPASNRNSCANLSNSPTKSPTKRTSTYTDFSRPTSTRPPSVRPNSTRPRSTQPQSAHSSLLNDNWVTYPSPSPSPQPISSLVQNPPELRHLRVTNPVSRSLTGNFSFTNGDENLVPKPLEMNPPTPPNPSFSRGKRALTPLSGNAESSDNSTWYEEDIGAYAYPSDKSSRPSSVRQDSFGTVGGKARYYGQLYGGKATEPRQSRVLSSGRDTGMSSHGMRAREVSGKVMEEGRGLRAGMAY